MGDSDVYVSCTNFGLTRGLSLTENGTITSGTRCGGGNVHINGKELLPKDIDVTGPGIVSIQSAVKEAGIEFYSSKNGPAIKFTKGDNFSGVIILPDGSQVPLSKLGNRPLLVNGDGKTSKIVLEKDFDTQKINVRFYNGDTQGGEVSLTPKQHI